MSEAEFQVQVLQLARLYGWRTLHLRHARTARGWRTPVAGNGVGYPDLTLCRERVLFAELKSETGTLTVEQEAWLESLRNAGAEVYCWRPSDWDDIERTLR